MFKPLSERQKTILGLLVRTYIEEGQAIGSKTLVSRYVLDVSSATVRNELAALDELGYITQLHTSAGRIPTEDGYRYFVQRLLGDFELPSLERQTISHQFHQARVDFSQWMKLAAAVLAQTSQGASFVTAPRPQFNRFKHVELISTQGRQVLMILVLYGGDVKQQMLMLASPLSQIRLSQTAERVSDLFEGRNFEEITSRLSQLNDDLDEDVSRLIIDILRHADVRRISEIYRDGLSNILDDEGTRQAVRVIEEQSMLADVISDVQNSPSGVQVLIGGDGRWEELSACTMILARYGVDEDLVGEVAVVGPTRMAYGRNISAVRYVADLMSGFVTDYFIESPEGSVADEVSISE